MPHANIWIRKENEDIWETKIEDKSAWVNRKLREEEDEMEALRESGQVVEATKPSKGLCEHGKAKKQCFQPQCKNSRY